MYTYNISAFRKDWQCILNSTNGVGVHELPSGDRLARILKFLFSNVTIVKHNLCWLEYCAFKSSGAFNVM